MDYSAFIEGINTKNEKAWGKLYDHYYASLCSYVEKLLSDPEYGRGYCAGMSD